MRAWAGKALHRPALVALLVLAAVGAAAAGTVAATIGSEAADGVRHLAAPARVSVETLKTRGLAVTVAASSDERVLLLRLTRRAGTRVTIARSFRLSGHAGRVCLRWRVSASTAARL